MTPGRSLLTRVLKLSAEQVADATEEDCVNLLDGALRLGVSTLKKDVELETEVLEFVTAALDAEEAANEIEFTRKETTVSSQVEAAAERQHKAADQMMQDAIEATKRSIAEMLAKEAAEAPEQLEVAPETAAGTLEVAVIENIWALGTEGLARKTVRQLKALCRLLSAKVGGRKAEIVARLAQLAELNEMPKAKAPVGDPKKYAVTIAELLPSLVHRTSDGRWFLKEHKVAFLKTDTTRAWACKGIKPKTWAKYEGLVMLVPAVTIVA